MPRACELLLELFHVEQIHVERLLLDAAACRPPPLAAAEEESAFAAAARRLRLVRGAGASGSAPSPPRPRCLLRRSAARAPPTPPRANDRRAARLSPASPLRRAALLSRSGGEAKALPPARRRAGCHVGSRRRVWTSSAAQHAPRDHYLRALLGGDRARPPPPWPTEGLRRGLLRGRAEITQRQCNFCHPAASILEERESRLERRSGPKVSGRAQGHMSAAKAAVAT